MIRYNKLSNFFKKLKLFDYLVLLVIVIAGFALYKFLQQDKKTIEVSVVSNVSVFQINSLHVGDFETNSLGNKSAVIKRIEVSDVNFSGDQFFDKLVTLDVALLVDTNKQGTIFRYNNQALGVGSQVQFKFNSTLINGYVSEIKGNIDNNKGVKKILTIKFYGKYPWLAENLQIGKVNLGSNIIKNARIVSKDVVPAQVRNVTSSGDSVASIDPTKVDITLDIELELQQKGNIYIFQGYNTIYKGKQISFVLGDTLLNDGLVTNIK